MGAAHDDTYCTSVLEQDSKSRDYRGCRSWEPKTTDNECKPHILKLYRCGPVDNSGFSTKLLSEILQIANSDITFLSMVLSTEKAYVLLLDVGEIVLEEVEGQRSPNDRAGNVGEGSCSVLASDRRVRLERLFQVAVTN